MTSFRAVIGHLGGQQVDAVLLREAVVDGDDAAAGAGRVPACPRVRAAARARGEAEHVYGRLALRHALVPRVAAEEGRHPRLLAWLDRPDQSEVSIETAGQSEESIT